MGAWVNQVHRRAALVHDQIAAALKIRPDIGIEPRELIAPYQALLDKLYLDELPYARLLDNSDLVVNADGPATASLEPRVSALAYLLERLRDESKRLAKVIGGIKDDDRVDNIDLLLSGIARGSLVIGLKVTPPTRDTRQTTFLTEDEPVFRAVRAAIQALSKIPHLLTEKGVNDEIVALLPDPALRDATLVTAHRLSPSGRTGIDRVQLTAPGAETGTLTIEDRATLRRAIANPVMRQPARGTFRGIVRELDLDAKRIEVRQIPQVGTIRCVVEEFDAAQARRWINKLVRVSGLYEKDATGQPRFLRADKVVIEKTPRQLKLR